MKAITYRITLMEPALVTALEGDPNSGVAYDYLPGSVLRGVALGKYLRAQGGDELDITDGKVRRLFFDGSTRYLNGYLLDRPVPQGKPSLPVPASWQIEKSEEKTAFDFAVIQEPEAKEAWLEGNGGDEDGNKEPQWKGLSSPFWTPVADKVQQIRPARHIAVHTARTRRFGRAMPIAKIDLKEGDTAGAVYRYDALASAQIFEASIVCDNDADEAELRGLLGGEVTLGGSRSGGYGRAKLEVVSPEGAGSSWREVGGALTPDVDGKLIVTLLSHALLRDESGQFAAKPCVVTRALAARAGIEPGDLVCREAFLGVTVIGGFNRKWGLPLPQALAIKMGSVLVYDAPSGLPSEKLADLETHGIGERRAEGFGRVAVNWHSKAELELEIEARTTSAQPDAVSISKDTVSAALAKRMVIRLVEQRLDDGVVAAASRVTISNPPGNAQLSRLRNLIHDELAQEKPGATARIKTYLGSVEKRRSAREQFQKARIGKDSLLAWLDRKCETASLTQPPAQTDTTQVGTDRWHDLLGVPEGDLRKIKIGGVGAGDELNGALLAKYTLRYVDAVLARAAKTRKEDS